MLEEAFDHRWPAINNHGDVVYSTQVDGKWEIFKLSSGSSSAVQLTSGDYNKMYPAIADSGVLVYYKDGGSGGSRGQVIRRNADGSEATIEFSSAHLGQHRDAGEYAGIASDGTSISYYDWYGGGERRFNVSGVGRLSNASGSPYDFGFYGHPDINDSGEIVYSSGAVRAAHVSSAWPGNHVAGGERARINDESDIVSVSGDLQTQGEVWLHWGEGYEKHRLIATGSWADINNRRDVVYEVVDDKGHRQIHLAPEPPDVEATSLEWNDQFDLINFGYRNTWQDLPSSGIAGLYWASGETYDTVIGDPVHTAALVQTIGDHGPFTVETSSLGPPPETATHLLFVVDPWDAENPHGQIDEGDEKNNVKAVPLPTDIRLVDAITRGSSAFELVVIDYKILHSDSAPFEFHAWLSTDEVFDPTPPNGGGDQPFLGTRRIESSEQLRAAANTTWSVILDLGVAQRKIDEQHRFILIVADGLEEVAEFNEKNNVVFVIPLFRDGQKMNRSGDGPTSPLPEFGERASGPYPKNIHRGTPEFSNLVRVDRSGTWEPATLFDFRHHSRNEPTQELKDEDRLVHHSLLEPTTLLRQLILKDRRKIPEFWAGYEYSINEAYDSTHSHGNRSRHYSGTAIDLGMRQVGSNQPPRNIAGQLSRLAGLAWLAGYDWIYAEISGNHVHVSERPVDFSPPPAGFQLMLQSPADLLVVDPLGRKTGVDPVSGQQLENIPDSYFSGIGSHPQVLSVTSPDDGDYMIQVIGNEPGAYTLGFAVEDTSARLVKTNVQENTNAGAISTYTLTLRGDDAPQMKVYAADNLPPSTFGDEGFTHRQHPIDIDVLKNDRDPDGSLALGSVTVASPPTGGTASVSSSTGMITYTPKPGFYGVDTLTYRVQDDEGASSNEGAVYIEVSPNHVPHAGSEDYRGYEDNEFHISANGVVPGLFANDVDGDGDEFWFSEIYYPDHGELMLEPDGSFTYAPNDDFFGVDSFSYTISDGAVTSDSAVVNLIVHPVYDGQLSGDVIWDLDGDGTLEPEEPPLAGWEIQAQRIGGEARLLSGMANPTPHESDFFGYQVVQAGENLLTATPYGDPDGVNYATATLFDGKTGEPIASYSDPSPDYDYFGESLAAVGNRIFVGARGKDTPGYGIGAVFEFNQETERLVRTYRSRYQGNGDFGCAIAADNDLVVIGERNAGRSGGVHLFDASSGNLLRRLASPWTASDFTHFGHAIALTDHEILVGAPLDDTGAKSAGRAYVFDPATGALLMTLANPTPERYEKFGYAVAAIGGKFVIGAPGGAWGPGFVYVFDGESGELRHTLSSPNPQYWDYFGSSVSAYGDDILIGARSATNFGGRPGAVYLFDGETGGLLREFRSPRTSAGDLFGNALAAIDGKIVVGAPGDNFGAARSGVVYSFDAGATSTTTDTAGEFRLTGLEHGEYRIRQILADGFLQTYPMGQAPHVLSITTDDDLGGVDFGAYTLPEPPEVVDVLLSSQSWDRDVDKYSLFDDVDSSLAAFDGTALDLLLPWINIDRIDVVFSEDVQVDNESLTLAGVNTPAYSPSAFHYQAGSSSATWTFSEPLAADKLLLNLAGEAADPSPIRSQQAESGQLLGGGSDYEIRFDLLPGDSTGDGATDIGDLVNIATRVPSWVGPPPSTNYSFEFDVNGDGTIDVGDLVNVATRVPSSLPDGEPGELDTPGAAFRAMAPPFQSGDANRDFLFEQLDFVQVLQAGKYMTGAPADWNEGDWNGDRLFDKLDIMAALQTGVYLQRRRAVVDAVFGGPFSVRYALIN